MRKNFFSLFSPVQEIGAHQPRAETREPGLDLKLIILLPGVAPRLIFPRVLIDVSPVADLKGYYFDQNLVFGAGTTLTDLMELFKTVAKERAEFQYLEKLYEHLDLVANIPVRNVSFYTTLFCYSEKVFSCISLSGTLGNLWSPYLQIFLKYIHIFDEVEYTVYICVSRLYFTVP